jgi:hypothetical protein
LLSLLTIKGAPDVLITRCTKFVSHEGVAKPLDENTFAEIERIKNQWSSEGKRVILLARKTICREQLRENPTSARYEEEIMHHARDGLTFVGIVGIVDPPRDEIPSVVKILRRAGIRIFMVNTAFSVIRCQTNSCLGHWRLCTHSTSHCYRVWNCHQSSTYGKEHLSAIKRLCYFYFRFDR